MIARRSFLTGLVSLVAAPAIVRVTSIMPVKALAPAHAFILRTRLPADSWRQFNMGSRYLRNELFDDIDWRYLARVATIEITRLEPSETAPTPPDQTADTLRTAIRSA